ncbi:hypothetical protein N0V93_005828 [Gnomoniopsis smithogilvyi]|uniref:Uncharacterized protein n=1 Tax=Gnomoniopsis smithogilvyi TaxID=1191159 RepID=A0A9W8YV52_9PEZI|nr:hypothetical protein N0V93_005828 [Gnomoniopsis smithogilvyi]
MSSFGDNAHYFHDKAGSTVTLAQTSCRGKLLTLLWIMNVMVSKHTSRVAHIVSGHVGENARMGHGRMAG